MIDTEKIETLLKKVKSKIEAHKEFKEAYNKKLAFDFSLFNFFDIGENKISKILTFFLNENETHGQGKTFLNEFINQFYGKNIDSKVREVRCEKKTTSGRKIDIYIEFEDTTIIAIENKIWAGDQDDQVKDYITYIDEQSKTNFLLLYLSPYGRKPSDKSIPKDYEISKNGRLEVINYTEDIKQLINRWLAVCEADNVSHFLKEFKNYLEIKFHGNNTLNMTNKIKEIILNNIEESELISKSYDKIIYELKEEFRDKVFEILKNKQEIKFKGIEKQVKMSKPHSRIWFNNDKGIWFGVESFSGIGHEQGILFVGIMSDNEKNKLSGSNYTPLNDKGWDHHKKISYENEIVNLSENKFLYKIRDKDKLGIVAEEVVEQIVAFIIEHKNLVY